MKPPANASYGERRAFWHSKLVPGLRFEHKYTKRLTFIVGRIANGDVDINYADDNKHCGTYTVEACIVYLDRETWIPVLDPIDTLIDELT